MYRSLLIAASALLFAAGAQAQTITANPSAPGVLTSGDTPTEAQWMSIMRAQALVALSPSLASKCGVSASACTITPVNGSAPLALGALFGDTFVVPDWYKLSGDGSDDAPSIRRAQATGMPVHFRCRHYTIGSPSIFNNRLQWLGCGAAMLSGSLFGTSSGTWLDVDASFQSGGGNANGVPFTIQSTSATGSVIDSLGISQVQPYPAGNATTWTPNAYNYVFVVQNTGGEVSFRHTFWPGVSNGIYSVNSGRFDISDMRGQWFDNAIKVDVSYDVTRLTDVHSWPYWADNVAVEQYQQSHLDTVILARSDTTFISRLFTIGARSGLKFTNLGAGATTGAVLSAVSCDFTQYCLWVDSTALGVTFQADAIRSFAQAFTNSGVAMLPNSSVLQVEGQIVAAQIGSIDNFGTSASTISLANGGATSTLAVGSITLDHVEFSAPNTQMVSLYGSGSNRVYLAAPPMIYGTPPSGYLYVNGVTAGGLFTPAYAKLTGAPQ